MKMSTFCQLSKDGIKNIWKNRMMSFASFTIVISTLFIFGLFISISFNFNTFTKGLEDKFQIRAYINKNFNEKQSEELRKTVKLYTEVKSIKYISKEDAIKEAQKKMKLDKSTVESFGKDKPFKSSIIINLKKADAANSLAEKLKKVEGIDKVMYGKDTINTLLKVNKLIQAGSIGIIVLLSIIAVFIISNTVKLTVMSRRREISIMKLIGATDRFIRLPFVIEGVGIGFFSAIVTFLICKFGYQYCYDNMKNIFAFMKLVSFDNIQIFLFTSFMTIGVLIGGLGSYISVKKYLSI